MPKRKKSKTRDEDLEFYRTKIRKLERKIRKRLNSDNKSDSKSVSEPDETISNQGDTGIDTPALQPDDWLLQTPNDEIININNAPEPQPGPSNMTETLSENHITNNNGTDLETEILEILGQDPSTNEKLGPEIRSELASRLLHILREGLNKENRKELLLKYQVPSNCVQINAPKINPEIKAAMAETAIKRDKGIETKQKQMSSAIACISEIINNQLNSKNKNNELLQKLMDANRILCDIQHADSTTRRNFILFGLKHDMKEHLKNTNIDTTLFGEELSDTLKSARAVNKSGTELKADTNKAANNKYKGPVQRPLNRRAPPQARRQPAGMAPPAPRSREPAGPRAAYPLPPPPPLQQPRAHSSRTSSQAHQATQYRRRY